MSKNSISYALATGHQITSEVAEVILQSGGNAFDAAVAAYLAAFISEPMMASAGAGGFANIYVNGKENQIIDFFCQTPLSRNQTKGNYKEIVVDFVESQESFFIGASSMAVPGAMAFINYLSNNLCTIPLRELVKPAQELATQGVKITSFQNHDIHLLSKIVLESEKGRSLFEGEDGVLAVGELLQMPQYADFLESFSRESGDWFYRGEVAQSIVNYSMENEGFLRYEDFENYQLGIVAPYQFDFCNQRITMPGIPSLAGGLMHLFLKEIENKSFSKLSSAHYLNLRKSFAEAIPYAKDSEKLMAFIADGKVRGDDFSGRVAGGTSHFNIVDRWGNGIALSTSIGEGSAYFIPGTDMQMNNMLGEPGLMPNGLDTWKENVRLNSMMCPVIVFSENDELSLLTGTGGSSRIPYSLAQLLINRYQLQLPLHEAVHLPRIYESEKDLYLEKGYDHDRLSKNRNLSEWEELEMLFGGAHSIDLIRGEAVGDLRREGSARIVKT